MRKEEEYKRKEEEEKEDIEEDIYMEIHVQELGSKYIYMNTYSKYHVLQYNNTYIQRRRAAHAYFGEGAMLMLD